MQHAWAEGGRILTAKHRHRLAVVGRLLSRLQETLRLSQSLPLKKHFGPLSLGCDLTGSVEASAANAAATAGGTGGSGASCWAAGTSGRRVSRLSSISLLPGP